MEHGKSSVAFVESEHHDNVLRVADTTMRKTSVASPKILAITLEAKRGTDNEKAMTLTQSFPLYRKAMAWSILFSMAIVMEGYDTSLLESFYAFPKFTKKYGEFIGNDDTPSPAHGHLADKSLQLCLVWRDLGFVCCWNYCGQVRVPLHYDGRSYYDDCIHFHSILCAKS
jgi:hypothetical protein